MGPGSRSLRSAWHADVRSLGSAIYLSLTNFPAAARCRQIGAFASLDFEQNKNKIGTIAKQEMEMTDLVQDVVSLLSMSTFIVTMAMWIGAM